MIYAAIFNIAVAVILFTAGMYYRPHAVTFVASGIFFLFGVITLLIVLIST